MAIKNNKKHSDCKGKNKTASIIDMIAFVENPKKSTEKLPELISEFSKVARYTINNNFLKFLYTSNVQLEL